MLSIQFNFHKMLIIKQLILVVNVYFFSINRFRFIKTLMMRARSTKPNCSCTLLSMVTWMMMKKKRRRRMTKTMKMTMSWSWCMKTMMKMITEGLSISWCFTIWSVYKPNVGRHLFISTPALPGWSRGKPQCDVYFTNILSVASFKVLTPDLKFTCCIV